MAVAVRRKTPGEWGKCAERREGLTLGETRCDALVGTEGVKCVIQHEGRNRDSHDLSDRPFLTSATASRMANESRCRYVGMAPRPLQYGTYGLADP